MAPGVSQKRTVGVINNVFLFQHLNDIFDDFIYALQRLHARLVIVICVVHDALIHLWQTAQPGALGFLDLIRRVVVRRPRSLDTGEHALVTLERDRTVRRILHMRRVGSYG